MLPYHNHLIYLYQTIYHYIELYLHLFPESTLPDELHNSLVDILITLKCYIKFNYNFNIADINDKINQLCIQYNCN